MRLFFAAIVVVAAGYLWWVFFQKANDTSMPIWGEKDASPASVAPPSGNPPAISRAAPAPAPTAPPGVFYATERVSVQTATGVKALLPGEEVKLMYRNKDGTMLVTNGRDEFVVKASSLTRNRPAQIPAAPDAP